MQRRNFFPMLAGLIAAPFVAKTETVSVSKESTEPPESMTPESDRVEIYVEGFSSADPRVRRYVIQREIMGL